MKMRKEGKKWYEKEKYEYFYDPYKYEHPSVTTDCVVFGLKESEKKSSSTYKLHVLLIKRKKDAAINEWALPGGFIRINESAEDGTKRELKEETHLELDSKFLRQFHAYSDPIRDPRERIITIAFYALVNVSEVKGDDDASDAKWESIDNVPQLAFDHNVILNDALEALRRNIYIEQDIIKLLPEKFTMTQVQHLYEAILNVRFDRRNFGNKMLRHGILEALDERVTLNNSMEAGLYKFNEKKYVELKKFWL